MVMICKSAPLTVVHHYEPSFIIDSDCKHDVVICYEMFNIGGFTMMLGYVAMCGTSIRLLAISLSIAFFNAKEMVNMLKGRC